MPPSIQSRVSRLLGGAIALYGCWSIVSWSVIPLCKSLYSVGEGPNPIFALIGFPLLAIPGAIAAYYGYRMAKVPNRHTITRGLAIVAILGALLSAAAIEHLLSLPEKLTGTLSLLFATLLIVLAYTRLCNALVPQHEKPLEGGAGFVGKWTAYIIAIQLWVVSCVLFEEYAPAKEGSSHIKEGWWDLASLFVPFLFAWASYRGLIWFYGSESGPQKDLLEASQVGQAVPDETSRPSR